jgi:hypothetical protein
MSNDKTQQSVGEHDTDCNLKRDDHQRLEGCNCSLRVLAVVRLAAEGSDWKRDSGESLASWVQRRLARSHAAPVGEDAIQQVMWAVFSYADRREAFTDAPVGEPRHIARQSLQAQEDYIRGLLTKMMPSAKE